MDDCYIKKHLALAEKLSLDPLSIDNESDSIFYLLDEERNIEQEFWVMDSDETLDVLKGTIIDEFSMPFTEFNLSYVAKSLGVDEKEIKEFFLAEILSDEVNFSYNMIDVESLKKYIQKKHTLDEFVDVFAKFIMKINKSGSYLCSMMQENIQDGFHIFYR